MGSVAHDFSKIEEFLDKEIAKNKTPGIQFLVADKSGVLYNYNNGLADIASETKVDASTQFKMYSSTKLLTMLAIMQLVEKGEVQLDAPISDYLDYDFPKEITIRKVLSHTAGFSRYPFAKEIHLAEDHSTYNYSDFVAEMLPKHSALSYKVGQKNVYSNYGYMVLSAIVEQVSGQAYKAYVQDNIIARVSLQPNSYLGFNFTDATATAYQKRGTFMHFVFSKMVDTDTYFGPKYDRWQSYHPLYMEGVGFGGGFANAQGLADLFLAVLDHKILSEETLKLTFEPQTYKKGKESKQALGWWLGSLHGQTCFHHAGGGGGFSCDIHIYPQQGIVRIMMMNRTQSFSDLRMFTKVDKLWFDAE